MGKKKIRVPASDEDRHAFIDALLSDLRALEKMLEGEEFERAVQRIGTEQELYLIKHSIRPNPVVMSLLDKLKDDHYTTEHSQYNLEINTDPIFLEGRCLSMLEQSLKDYLNKARDQMRKMKGDIALVGILPSLRRMDLDLKYLTPVRRYQALSNTMNKIKGGPYEFRINGTDELVTKHDTTMFEGSNTSFQVHLQVAPERFVEQYNLSQLVTAPLLAAATNSPMLLGKRLWRETRIALFQQSVDTRKHSYELSEKSPRVSFGNHWLEGSIANVFKDNIARHRILLVHPDPEDAEEVLKNGGIPALDALQVHNGTVYTWNRACYGITEGKPHLRIENRVLPSGPTVRDEVANAAFWLGMMHAPWPGEYFNLPEEMEFDKVKANFIKAARYGLETQFNWIGGEVIPADVLILEHLLPMAVQGLEKAGLHPEEIHSYTDVIRKRVQTGQTGSQWILDAYSKLRRDHSSDVSLVSLTAGMIRRQYEGDPVHSWDLPGIEEAGPWRNRFWRIHQIMTTEVFSVRPEDPVTYANHIMNWKFIRHVPVEDEHGKLIGVVSARLLLEYYAGQGEHPPKDRVLVRDIMYKDPYVVTPETKTTDAIELMKKHKVGFLPVVSNELLVGIVTEHDFMQIAAHFMKDSDEPDEEI